MKDLTEHAAFSSQSVNTAYCVMCLLISAKVQFCWHWTGVNRCSESKFNQSSLFGHQKMREVWKTFLTLTGAFSLIALFSYMDRKRLRKAFKSCKKKNIYMQIAHITSHHILVNEYINYRCQRNGCLVHWGNHIVEHLILDDFKLVWLVLFNCSSFNFCSSSLYIIT